MSDELEELFPPEHPGPCRVDPADHPPRWLVGGEVRSWSGASIPVHSRVARRTPEGLTPVLLGAQAALGAAQAEEALEAAERAWDGGFGAWPRASTEGRCAAVASFAARIAAHTDEIARLLMLEIGKPKSAATKEVTRSVAYIRETIAELRALEEGAGTPFTGRKGSTVHHARELRLPIGRVLCVAPFNYPVNELLTTVVPALLMGNVVLAKTPRFGVLANMVLASAFAECFPPGTMALLPGEGREVIPSLIGARDGSGRAAIDMFAFIGSERAATAIMREHPQPISLHKVLGLGAKNAAVLLPGVELAEVVPPIVRGALGFNGQRCTAEKLLCVPQALGEECAEAVAAEVAALSVGMPWEDAAITPLPEPDKLAWMRELIADATAQGARIVNAGGGAGSFSLMRPAVLFPVVPRMRIFAEEQFGPIVPIAPYANLEEVHQWQRESPFGQQIGLWGPRAEVADAVRRFAPLVARVNLNDVCQRGPDSFGFTATDKSGFGVLSLRDALLTFSRPVLVQALDAEALA